MRGERSKHALRRTGRRPLKRASNESGRYALLISWRLEAELAVRRSYRAARLVTTGNTGRSRCSGGHHETAVHQLKRVAPRVSRMKLLSQQERHSI